MGPEGQIYLLCRYVWSDRSRTRSLSWSTTCWPGEERGEDASTLIAAAWWILSSKILLGRVSHCDGQGSCHLHALHWGGEEGGKQAAQTEAARLLSALLRQLRHQNLWWFLHPQCVRVEW